jgi:hypothetical protein
MTELHWLPRDIGKLTITQLVCLCSKQPPGKERIDSPEAHAAEVRREAEYERAWRGD